MPKEIKRNRRRTPPEPAAGHSDIEDWFGRVMPNLQPIVWALDESIRPAVVDRDYAVKYESAFYGLRELGWMVEIAPYDVSVNVLFFGGADFDPLPPLANIGRTRDVKVTTLTEVKPPGTLGGSSHLPRRVHRHRLPLVRAGRNHALDRYPGGVRVTETQ